MSNITAGSRVRMRKVPHPSLRVTRVIGTVLKTTWTANTGEPIAHIRWDDGYESTKFIDELEEVTA